MIPGLRKVKFGDIVLPEDHNAIVNFLLQLKSKYPESGILDIRTVKNGDIVLPEDHNAIVESLKNFTNYASKFTDVSTISNKIDKLSYVNFGDPVLSSQHNLIVDILNEILGILPLEIRWFPTVQYDYGRTGYYPLTPKYIVAPNLNGYIYIYDNNLNFVSVFGTFIPTVSFVAIDSNFNCYASTGVYPNNITLFKKFRYNVMLCQQKLNGFCSGNINLLNDGSILVTDNSSRIYKILGNCEIASSKVIGPQVGTTYYSMMVVDKNGNIYLGNGSDKFIIFDKNLNEIKYLEISSPGTFTAYDLKNNVVLFDSLLNEVYCINTKGDILYTLNIDNIQVRGITIKNEVAYITDVGNGKIWLISTKDGKIINSIDISYGVGIEFASICSIDKNNNIYVGVTDETNYSYVYKIYNGIVVSKRFVGIMTNPNPIVDSDGYVYTKFGNYGWSLAKLDSNLNIVKTSISIGNEFGFYISLY